jgi:hypothetical protein
MPIHDWALVDPGLFHNFHLSWVTGLCAALNASALPADYFALVQPSVQDPTPDALTFWISSMNVGPGSGEPAAALSVEDKAPGARFIRRDETSLYSRRANRIVVRHRHGEVVAVVEIVSPGNKGSKSELQDFVDKSVRLIRQGIHLLVIDLFPPTKRDSQGIHKAIWDEFEEDEQYQLPADKPLVLTSYDAGPSRVAYVEFVGVGDPLPEMSIFLRPGYYSGHPLTRRTRRAGASFPGRSRDCLIPVGKSRPPSISVQVRRARGCIASAAINSLACASGL